MIFRLLIRQILSQIYEKFLEIHVVIDEGRQLSIVSEPEVVASNGVVPTPKIIVEKNSQGDTNFSSRRQKFNSVSRTKNC